MGAFTIVVMNKLRFATISPLYDAKFERERNFKCHCNNSHKSSKISVFALLFAQSWSCCCWLHEQSLWVLILFGSLHHNERKNDHKMCGSTNINNKKNHLRRITRTRWVTRWIECFRTIKIDLRNSNSDHFSVCFAMLRAVETIPSLTIWSPGSSGECDHQQEEERNTKSLLIVSSNISGAREVSRENSIAMFNEAGNRWLI